MQYRVADVFDIKNMLPSEVDKSAYDPDQVDLVFYVNLETERIDCGSVIDSYLSAFQMFNVVYLPDGTAELVPVTPWRPIKKENG